MTDRIALQLYTIRDVVGQDNYENSIRQVAAMGYRAVETAGFPGTTPEAALRLFKELGLTIAGAHVPLPLGENKAKVLETLEALEKPPLICTQIGPNDVTSMDTIRQLCDRLNEGYAVAKENGLAFAIHNHWWEFGSVEGRLVHHIMLELLDPGIDFEVDTYWVKVGGSDPAEIVKALGPRASFLHIKDGPANREEPMTAVGDGVMDVPAILAAAGENAKWLVVEMDRCATDVMEAAQKSYDYLKGLEQGR